MSRLRWGWSFFLLFFFTIVILPSQEAAGQVLYGTIVGSVEDQTGAVIPGATVAISNRATGQRRETVTLDTGAYSFPDVQAGSYDLTVTVPGFKSFSKTGLSLSINTVLRIDARLEVGEVTESVTVGAEVTALQTDRSDVKMELSGRETRDLPLGGYRNFQELLKLTPGITPPQNAHSIAGNPMRSMVMNVNGTSRSNNNTRVDGASTTFLWLPHIIAYVPPVEAIDAINVVTNSYDAEQGFAGGAVANVHLKSGTNDFHGSLFEFHTNSRLRARNFFFLGGRLPKNILNQFGGTLGGPIVRDKLFFFVNYEGMRQSENASRFVTVPTAEQRKGDFSATGARIYDPLSGKPDGSGRTLFANGLIPAERLNAIALKMVNLIPLPNLPGFANNLFLSAPLIFNRDNFDVKINWNRSEKTSLFGRYSFLDWVVEDSLRLGPAGGFGVSTIQPGRGSGLVQSATLGGTYIFSPTLMLDGHVAYTRQAQQGVNIFEFGKNLGLDFLGIPGTNGPDIRQSGFPRFAVSGYEEFGNPANYNPFFYRDNQFQYAANAAWTKKSHNLRWGMDLSRQHMNQFQPEVGSYGPRGGFDFSGGVTALRGGAAPTRFNSMAAFLLGLPSAFGKSFQTSIPMSTRVWAQGFYFRDQWHATRSLTVNIGLRWEYYPFLTRDHRGAERYDWTLNKVLIGGVGRVPGDAGVQVSKKLFAPRLGIAYRIGTEMVVRAGYGISIDPYPLGRPLRDNFPVVINRQFTGPNTFQPAGSLSTGIPPDPLIDLGDGIIDIPAVATTNTVDPEFRRGYVQSYNLTLQRRMPWDFTWQVGYVGTRSIRQTAFVNINAARPGTGAAGRPLNILFKRTADTRVHRPIGTSDYHSLQSKLDRRFSGGFLASVSYTFSKSMGFTDNSDNSLFFNVPEFFHRNRALTGFDRTHNLQVYSILELPFGRGKRWANSDGFLNKLVGGWQINAIFSALTGTPFTVSSSAVSLNAPGNSQVADQVKPNVEKFGKVGRGNSYFDPLAFRSVTEPRFGNAGRNILRGPGYVNLDFGLFRDFKLTETWTFQFRAEAFNLSNTPHFNGPGANVSNMSLNSDGTIRSLGGFSEVTSAQDDERQFRFALRLNF